MDVGRWKGGGKGSYFLMGTEFVWEDESVQERKVPMVAQQCEST